MKKEITNKNANNTIDTTTNIIIETLIGESFLKATDEYCDNTNSFHKTDDIPNSPPSSTPESANYPIINIHRAFVFKRFRRGRLYASNIPLCKKNWDKYFSILYMLLSWRNRTEGKLNRSLASPVT